VAPLTPDSAEAIRIDEALAYWRQGDVTLDVDWFVHAAQPALPLTVEASQAENVGPQLLTTEVAGVIVVTQTCDIVRSCVERPFVELSPLVAVGPEHLQNISRARMPGYAYVPSLAASALVADLDRVMTVEKSVLAECSRTCGWSSDEEARDLARALARKRARFAFPDDFAALVRKLQSRLIEKHGRGSREGQALRELREIRVHAEPSWEADSVDLTFLFIPSDASAPPGGHWETHLERWLELVVESGRFQNVSGFVIGLERLSAREYLESDLLDLDHLSMRRD
jgi:hypothetical protein